jgi:PKD repeat protein
MKRRKLVLILAVMGLLVGSISGCMKLQPMTPQAMFTASEAEHIIPFTASFDGTLSYNPDGEIVSYLWMFGDGGSDTGPVVDHVFQQDGVYDVTLTVFDSEGRTASTSMRVQALNPLPTAEFTYSPRSTMEENMVVSASEWITFDGADSTDDGEVVAYRWNFGDGTESDGQVVEHRWLWPGTYNVVLTVTDNDGDESTCVEQITVLGGAPCNADVTGDVPWSCGE